VIELAIFFGLLAGCAVLTWALYVVSREESDFDTSMKEASGAAIFLTALALTGWILWTRWIPIGFIVLAALIGVGAFSHARNPATIAAREKRRQAERREFNRQLDEQSFTDRQSELKRDLEFGIIDQSEFDEELGAMKAEMRESYRS
jgi:predicted membrane protein